MAHALSTYLEHGEVEGLAHLLDLLHDLPVGDLGPGLLELGQLDGNVEPGDGLEEQTLGLEEVKSVFDIVASLDYAHDELVLFYKRSSMVTHLLGSFRSICDFFFSFDLQLRLDCLVILFPISIDIYSCRFFFRARWNIGAL